MTKKSGRVEMHTLVYTPRERAEARRQNEAKKAAQKSKGKGR